MSCANQAVVPWYPSAQDAHQTDRDGIGSGFEISAMFFFAKGQKRAESSGSLTDGCV